MVVVNYIFIEAKSNTGVRTVFSLVKLIFRYDTYYSFTTGKLEFNYDIPRIGKIVRITDMSGAPIRLGIRRVRTGQYRMVHFKENFQEQLSHAFWLFDTSTAILKQV